jgi:hypothetical protein
MAEEAEDAFDDDEAEVERNRDREDGAEIATDMVVMVTMVVMPGVVAARVVMGPVIVGVVAMSGMLVVVAVMRMDHGLILHAPEFCSKR